MKKILILSISLIIISNCLSQSKDSTEAEDYFLNLTTAASTPGFSILGISPSEIERPKDPTDFAVYLQNATENFSVVPKSYALEVSAGIFKNIFNKTNAEGNDFVTGSSVGSNLLQNLTLSIGSTAIEPDSNGLELTRLGIGLKTSILKGNVSSYLTGLKADNKDNIKKLDSIAQSLLNLKDKKMDFLEANDKDYKTLKDRREEILKMTDGSEKERLLAEVFTSIQSRGQFLVDKQDSLLSIFQQKAIKDLIEEEKKTAKALNDKLSDIKLIRLGSNLDIAGAFVIDFPNQDYKKGEISKWGFWGVYSYNWGNPNTIVTSFSVVSKILGLRETIKQDSVSWKNNLDLGGKLTFDWKNFYFSGEYILKLESKQKGRQKYLVDFGYNLGDNKIVVFNFGKEFDGEPFKKGTLIAALNFVIGLGSKRPLSN